MFSKSDRAGPGREIFPSGQSLRNSSAQYDTLPADDGHFIAFNGFRYYRLIDFCFSKIISFSYSKKKIEQVKYLVRWRPFNKFFFVVVVFVVAEEKGKLMFK